MSIASLFNSVRKHVAIHAPATLHWHNSHALATDAAAAAFTLQHSVVSPKGTAYNFCPAPASKHG